MNSARQVIVAVAAMALALTSCSLAVKVDRLEGHPCSATGTCLPGYRCVDALCVPTEGGGKLCDPDCKTGRQCDLRVGQCTDPCSATVCPSGTTCVAGSAECAPMAPGSGIGAACQADADCAASCGAVAGNLQCSCFFALDAPSGVCLGLPRLAGDCSSCPEGTRCEEAPFSVAGASTLCLPGGLRACGGVVECQDTNIEHHSHCGFFAWPNDPAWQNPEQGLGLLSACLSDLPEAAAAAGESCDPGAQRPCATGLCVPTIGGGHLCSVACTTDLGCEGIGVGRCVRAPVEGVVLNLGVSAVAPVCGSSPTLGAACDSASGGSEACGTDAPLCRIKPGGNERICTRRCLINSDCPAEQGFSCNPDGFTCF